MPQPTRKPPMTMHHQQIAQELGLSLAQVQAVLELFESGATIPFIARYRKEKTGNLDEVQIRDVRDRFEYLTELEERRQAVLASIEEQGKLTDGLKQQILQAVSKQKLEDLYLPYRPKRKTKASIAKEKGLEPLALLLKEQKGNQEDLDAILKTLPQALSPLEALQGARDILAEWMAEDAEQKEALRNLAWHQGKIASEVKKEHAQEKTKFTDYYQFSEEIKKIPAHRFLAIRRGEEEGILRLNFDLPQDLMLSSLQEAWLKPKAPFADQLDLACQDALSRLLLPSLEVELRLKLKTQADEDSITIFSQNLRDLLLAPLGGAKAILGLDPGLRTGTKWVVVDETGKLLDFGTFFPVARGQTEEEKAKLVLLALLQKHQIQAICLGNGTASREVSSMVRALLKKHKLTEVQLVIVNESGASVYSASDLAREEFPDLDVSYRGAVSIARRFQDPLAELVKIDPKSIGVGQYQHDVNQTKLKRSLDETVESCVNFVGVNLNTASWSLLSYVSGLNKTLAKNIVAHRDQQGGFLERKELLKVARFGPKAYEQSAGFLRIKGGKNPLDASAVHPENYPVVQAIAQDLKLELGQLVGNEAALSGLNLSKYQSEGVGSLTLKDILQELKKPGRDPRSSYVGAQLDEEVQSMEDLRPGMELEGTITNLTKFGAFVDLGVHQDGLVHLSQMADRYIKEPSEVCAVGQVVKVKVLEVDIPRKRISLSMKSSAKLPQTTSSSKSPSKATNPKAGPVSLEDLAQKFKSH